MTVYAEYHPQKKQPDCVSDMLCWRAMVAPNVVLQKERGLQRSYRVRGPDKTGKTPEMLGAQALRANEVLKRFGGQWMFQSEAQRRRVASLPLAQWGAYGVAAWIDQCRRRQLLETPGSFETTYFVTLTYQPTPAALTHGLRWFLHGPGATPLATEDASRRTVRDFIDQADAFMGLLSGMLAECKALSAAEAFTYLHSTVSDTWHEVGTLACWMGIDSQLADTPWHGGWYPVLGDPRAPDAWQVRLCSIAGYPHRSVVGVLQTLDLAEVEYRWCVRWEGMQRQMQEGILRRQQHAWVGEEKTMGQFYAEKIGGDAARVTDTSALNKAAELDAARQETGHDLVAYGDFTTTIMVWDADALAADTKLRLVRQALQDRGFPATVETEEATPAWFSTHPGNKRDHVARTPQSSLTVEHLCPGLDAAWRGPERDEYLGGLPWLYAVSRGTTLIRIVNHVRDLGHFLCLGSTRAGKSTLLGILRAAWMQYRQAQATLFDLDGHGRLLTYLLGGAWHDLGTPGVRYAPFQGIDDPLRKAFVKEWVVDLLADYGIPRDQITLAAVGRTLDALAQRPARERTMTTLVGLMAVQARDSELHAKAGHIDAQGIAHQDPQLMDLVRRRSTIHSTLKMFTTEGEYAGLFDAATDDLTTQPVQTFEMRALLARPSILSPVLRYVFLHVEQQMSTAAPMLLLLDDAAVAWMADSLTAAPSALTGGKREEKIQMYLQTTAKKSVSLGFSTHSLVKVFGGALGTLLQEACPSRFYLPNGAALEPDIYDIYTRLGLTDPAIQLLAKAPPQRSVYYKVRDLGESLIDLPLPPEVLACVARNSAADHALMDQIMQAEGPDGFAVAWLRAQHCTEGVTFLERYHHVHETKTSPLG